MWKSAQTAVVQLCLSVFCRRLSVEATVCSMLARKWGRRRSSAICWPLSNGTLRFESHCSAIERWQRNILKKDKQLLRFSSDARIYIWYYLFMKFFWDFSKLMGSFFKGILMTLTDGCIMFETRSSQPETLLFSLWRVRYLFWFPALLYIFVLLLFLCNIVVNDSVIVFMAEGTPNFI
jgi:hypothetical protein